MLRIRNLLEEKWLHLAFEISLLGKAVLAVIETLSGVVFYFIKPAWLLSFVAAITQDELAEDPHDFVATHLLRWAEHLSVNAQHFMSIYLVAHGVIKLVLIVGLLRKILWFYPVGIAVFGGFIAYQLYRFTFTHSPWLVFLTVVDLVVIWLTWHEYRLLARMKSAHRD